MHQGLDDFGPPGSQVGPAVARISRHKEPHCAIKSFDFHVCQGVRKNTLGSAELRSLNLTLKVIGGVENDGAGGVRKIRKTRDRKSGEAAMGMTHLAK